jgi:hypothetical protein
LRCDGGLHSLDAATEQRKSSNQQWMTATTRGYDDIIIQAVKASHGEVFYRTCPVGGGSDEASVEPLLGAASTEASHSNTE